MDWIFDHYQVGKRRQWVGAPVPVLVRYRVSRSDYLEFSEEVPDVPEPRLKIGPEGFGFERRGANEWVARVDTNALGPGVHELIFDLGDNTTIHASDQTLLLLDARDYRTELLEEANEAFLPSRGISHYEQLRALIDSVLGEKLPQSALQRVGSLEASRSEELIYASHSEDRRYVSRLEDRRYAFRSEKIENFARPVAIAPIYWVLEALISEFIYLSTFVGHQTQPYNWGLRVNDNNLDISCYMRHNDLIDAEAASAVANRELGLLHLLNGGGDKRFQAQSIIRPDEFHLSVNFDMYEAPVTT